MLLGVIINTLKKTEFLIVAGELSFKMFPARHATV